MSGISFTEQQQAAIDTLDQNVSVSAGAGAGKTEVLVHRFCNIVEQGKADVDEILTVTFTEKAAKEMKQRIVRRFDQRFRDTGDRRFEEARRNVEFAYIGTIHSFAARVLRENAFEAGIDPKFGMLTDAEAETLKDSVLDDLITDGYATGNTAYVDVVLALGKSTISSNVKKLYGHLCSLGHSIQNLPAAILADEDAEQSLSDYIELMETILAKSGSLGGKLDEQLADFAPRFPGLKVNMQRALAMLQSDDLARYTADFDWDHYEELSIAVDFVDNRVGGKDVKEQLIKPAKEAVRAFLSSLISPMGVYYANCLKAITADFQREYAEAKHRVGVLDFDDLLLTTHALLLGNDGGRTQAARDYEDKFKFVVMDEFQDTNALQKGIIDAVCRPDRLFTVGDFKQSIFSFIHSDVSVFVDHHESMKQDGKGKPLAFVENFRSRKDIIGFVNWFFEQIWLEDGDFEFEQLVSRGSFHDKEGPEIELLFVPKDAGIDQARLVEARAIANRINDLLGRNGNPPLQVTKRKGNDLPRSLQPGDIMLLFRSTKHIALYERALREAGIEYYIVSGRGFYSTHEVQDILNVLRIIDNPLNDVAMASVLRSPMVAVSADALWWLTRDHIARAPVDEHDPDEETDVPPKNRFIGKLYSSLGNLEKLTGLDDTDRDKLIEFRDTLRILHSIRSESRITRLLGVALSQTHCELKLLASENGRRKYANIRKLMGVAETFESRGIFSLSDFVRHIENLVVMADREGEAPTETEESPVVRLMTVHKAKGLQAPVVFVADCSRSIKAGDSDTFVVDKNAGIACKLRNPLTDELVATGAHKMVSDALKQKDIKEEKRLLYVAATRAEELLVLCGASDFKGSAAAKDSYSEVGLWSGWLEKAFSITSHPGISGCALSAGDIPVFLSAGNGISCCADVSTPSVFQAYPEILMSGEKLPVEVSDAGREIIERCFSQRPTCSSTPVVLSVTRILDYMACPRKYQLRWVLGIDESVPTRDYSSDEPDSKSSADLGLAVHQMLGSVDFALELAPQLEHLAELQDLHIRATALESCTKLLTSPWLSRISNAEIRMQETPFNARLDTCNIVGRIDLLIKDEAGWIVVDYKTGSGSDSARYKQQIGIYALAVEKCLGVRPKEVALISLGGGTDYSLEVDGELLEDTEALLHQVAGGVRSRAFDCSVGSECHWCGYKGRLCREQGDAQAC